MPVGPHNRWGYCNRSIECRREANRLTKRAAYARAQASAPVCRECGGPVNRNCKSRICTRTLRCRAARARLLWARDADKRRRRSDYQKQWYRANRDRVRAAVRRYYERLRAARWGAGLTAAGRVPKHSLRQEALA